MKVALIHDWLIHMRGGEKVLEALYEVFPDAEIYTLFCRKEKISQILQKAKIHTSFLQYFPGVFFYYRWLLPLMPFMIRTFRLKKYDLIVSSSHCVAKGVKIPKGSLHVCYCHTPIRYVWGFRADYFSRYPAPCRGLIHWVLDRLRKWDLGSNRSVHFFVANSENTSRKIQDLYGRDAEVVYPPVESLKLSGASAKYQPKDYFFIVSAMVPYKKIDLAIEAFNRLELPLVIAGDGPESARLKELAGPSVRFLGTVTDEELLKLYAECRALIFPGEEDFGMVPVEVQACGRPVIAYAKGGALESVTGATGVFFNEQSVESLMEAVKKFDGLSFHSYLIRDNALKFDRQVFKQRMQERVLELYESRARANGNIENPLTTSGSSTQ